MEFSFVFFNFLFIYLQHLLFNFLLASHIPCSNETNDFLCDNLQCIRRKYVCNGEDDCLDYSDEKDCKNRPCLDEFFKCNDSSICRPIEWKCDGENDCKDNSDEIYCGVKSCDSNTEFRCLNGQCIRSLWKCDGEDDCFDASDERNCSDFNCSNYQFQCKESRRCISLHLRCDNEYNPDCDDKSDEADCPTVASSKVICPFGHLPCGKSNGNGIRCILESWVCDGDTDCPDESDELNCKKHRCSEDEHSCDSYICLEKSKVCDGQADCQDQSDESICDNTGCNLSTSYLCQNNSTCVSKSRLCNRQPDCPDGDDEVVGINQCFTNECQLNNGNCSHRCVDLDFKYRCSCLSGYKLDDDGRTCIDIDECKDKVDNCDQQCINLNGSFKCSCHDGYAVNEFRVCKLINASARSHPVHLIFTDKTQVIRIASNRGKSRIWFMSILADHLNFAAGLCLDVARRMAYWTDVKEDYIGRVFISPMRYSPFKPKKILSGKTILRSSFGIAFDWIHDHLYWSDQSWRKISVSFINGSFPTTIISDRDFSPRALALHPGRGFMFVIASGDRHVVYRYDMDGTNKRPVVERDLILPTTLTIDFDEDRLFWLDMKLHQLSSCDFDGGHRVVVLKSSYFLKKPFGIALLYDLIYWTDHGSRRLCSCNKWTGKHIHVIDLELQVPYSLKVDHPRAQPQFASHCRNHHCQFMCLPSTKNYTCVCPNGYIKLVDDGSKCLKANVDHNEADVPLTDRHARDNRTATGFVETEVATSPNIISPSERDIHQSTSGTSLPYNATTSPEKTSSTKASGIFSIMISGITFAFLAFLLFRKFFQKRASLLKVKVEKAVYCKKTSSYQVCRRSEDSKILLSVADENEHDDATSQNSIKSNAELSGGNSQSPVNDPDQSSADT